MKIDITVNDSDEETLAMMRGLFSDLKGKLAVQKQADGSQVWRVTRDGITRTLVVLLKFNNFNKKDITKDTEREKEAEKSADQETGPSPAIVNDTPKRNFHPSRPMYRTRQDGGGSQVSLFEPVRTTKEDVKEFMDEWNSRMWLPNIRGTDRQCRIIRTALSRPSFKGGWRDAFAEILQSKFLRGANEKKFRLTLDWFLEADNFDKIIEGKYRDDSKPNQSTKHEPTYDTDTIT